MFLQAADFPIEAIRRQITEGIDILVHLGRLADKRRVVLDISEIEGLENSEIVINQLYRFDPHKGLVKTSNELKNTSKLELKGLSI